MGTSRILVTVSRTVGLTLLNHGVVTLAVSGTPQTSALSKQGAWQRGARKVFGDVVDAPGFALAEAAVGAVLVVAVPRLLGRR